MRDEVKVTSRTNGGAPYEWTIRVEENGAVSVKCDEMVWISTNGDGSRVVLRPNSAG